jgi:hypothetical protein
LALLYLQDGRYGKAERLRASVFSIVGAVKDNPDETLQVQFVLALGLEAQRRYGDAESLYREALSVAEKFPDSLSRGVLLDYLGALCIRTGRALEGASYLQRSVVA